MSVLILIPSQLELNSVADRIAASSDRWSVAKCGWGVLAAAINTPRRIVEYKPDLVILAGIAGAFDVSRNPVGSALEFDSVWMDGIGVVKDAGFLPASDLQWGMETMCDPDLIELNSPGDSGNKRKQQLLSVCAASGDANQARQRRTRFPKVLAEDMEGFAVATCCLNASVPVRIVKGISNEVGDRKHSNWQVDRALSSVFDLIETTL